MIQSLTIRNIVLIEELTISFHSGMHVLTGETGAGKSIVVDAVNLILGSRADKSLIRTGTEKASVEAVFDVPDSEEIRMLLQRESIDYDGRTVTVYREISSGGKNICRVCGVMVPVALLREIGLSLMDIHGQHEHQFLMDPEMHISFLDRMGDPEYQKLLQRTENACDLFLKTHRRYIKLRRENEQKKTRMDYLERSLKELREAKLKPGEEEALQQTAKTLRNSEKIVQALRDAKKAIVQGDGEQTDTLAGLKNAVSALQSLAPYGEKMKSLANRCESVYYELEEIAFELSSLIDESDHDPEKLEKAEDRLDLIRRLERTYGNTLADILAEQKKMESEYEGFSLLGDQLEQTGKEHKAQLSEYRAAARELSGARKALAAAFESRMMEQLKDLGMAQTEFRVCFAPPDPDKKPMPRPAGDDRLEFMISPNPGEPLKPLGKIASGGELSRLMLALKTLESEESGVSCMVFDEIDTGISGRMAQVVADKMRTIARHKQVICVTHLPQIAAAADHQYMVSKRVQEDRTLTSVAEMDQDGRIREIARMISGAQESGRDAEAYARSMLAASKQLI